MSDNETLRNARMQYDSTVGRISEAEELIAFMKDAGEDTVQAESRLLQLKARAKRWKDALDKAGYTGNGS